MRRRFEPAPDLNRTPIEKVLIPLQSRDELPPILAGLQWVWTPPTLKQDIFALLEQKILAGKKATGRPGMELWQILVLGLVRLGLDTNWDRLEHMANFDTLLRQMLGVEQNPWGREAKLFHHQTLRDNVALVDAPRLHPINPLVAASGREVFRKKDSAPLEALAIKVDSYVLETDVHFPTDLNLVWDAGRKCVDLMGKYRAQFGYPLPHWRRAKDWRRRLKALERMTSKVAFGGGANKEARVRQAAREYVEVARELSGKVSASLLGLCEQAVVAEHGEALAYFHGMLDKHRDLVDRRLVQGQSIPATEKVFSLFFEPHTEWIQKGKQRPPVELGHLILVATDQPPLIQDYDEPVGEVDVTQSVPVADRLLGRYGEGSLASLSFDKGFSPAEDRALLSLYIPEGVMPKRGKKTTAEAARESEKEYVALRRAHSAVESDINALEHHGLKRCLDVGLDGYRRHVGFGVLAFNLHQIGRRWLEQQRARVQTVRAAA